LLAVKVEPAFSVPEMVGFAVLAGAAARATLANTPATASSVMSAVSRFICDFIPFSHRQEGVQQLGDSVVLPKVQRPGCPERYGDLQGPYTAPS
jgi:hypothetical protein